MWENSNYKVNAKSTVLFYHSTSPTDRMISFFKFFPVRMISPWRWGMSSLLWLPVLANIIPAETRRKEALVNIVRKHEGTYNSMLSFMVKTTPKVLLKSRRPSWATGKALLNSNFRGTTDWGKEWGNLRLRNNDLISNPSIPLASFSLPRQNWVTLNRLRTEFGRCGQLFHRWHLKDNPACDGSESQQTVDHIIMDCPERKFQENIRVDRLNREGYRMDN